MRLMRMVNGTAGSWHHGHVEAHACHAAHRPSTTSRPSDPLMLSEPPHLVAEEAASNEDPASRFLSWGVRRPIDPSTYLLSGGPQEGERRLMKSGSRALTKRTRSIS